MSDSNFDLGNYFDDAKAEKVVMRNEGKEELLFEFDGFYKPKTVNSTEAVAHLINNLLFLIPGTYPDCPDMGINIQSYQFEVMNDMTIMKLREEIQRQVDKFINTISLRDLIIKKIDNEYIKKALGLGFEVSFDGKMNSEFFIFVSEDEKTKKVISQIQF